MRVFGAHVPVSGWTLAALLVGGTASVVLAGPLSRRTGWRRGPLLGTLLFLCGILALTLTPGTEPHSDGLRACLPGSFPGLVHSVLHTGGGVSGTLLNLVLFLPFTAAAVVTTGRWLATAIATVPLPLLIETAQSHIPGRYCSAADFVTNTAGALAGVLIGHFVLSRVPR
ncbi:hypothetical protein GCM10022222_49860 [Amycolatopsis ultiminotia]|uniref:VanZ-like domain-containing protein n=1 Tax=Amycolatopsis ultiminotia TaxID=543629 RepID=A0ABP6X322_9PSEU